MTGTWDDRPTLAGLVIAAVQTPFLPGHPPKPEIGAAEGDMGERALVRIAFSDVRGVDRMMAALEDVKLALSTRLPMN